MKVQGGSTIGTQNAHLIFGVVFVRLYCAPIAPLLFSWLVSVQMTQLSLLSQIGFFEFRPALFPPRCIPAGVIKMIRSHLVKLSDGKRLLIFVLSNTIYYIFSEPFNSTLHFSPTLCSYSEYLWPPN